MSARCVVAGVTFGVSVGFIACASNESATPGAPDADTKVPVLDSGVEASEGGEIDPCLPDALCSNGLFDPTNSERSIDLRTRIRAIRGRSSSDVWLLGAHGTILHFDGTSWKRVDTGTDDAVNGIWLRSSGEIALASLASVFTRGIALDTDAGASDSGWIAHGEPPGPGELSLSNKWVTSSWMAPEAEWLWVTTMESEFSFVNGLWRLHVTPDNTLATAQAAPPGTCAVYGCGQMTSIHGASADDLWAVGYTGALVRIVNAQSDAPQITPSDSQTWAGLNGVWAASPTEAWAVGGAGVIRHYTGDASSWDIVPDVPTKETLRAVWGTSSSDVWAVGDKSVVLHYDGETWSQMKVGGFAGRRPDLYAVWTAEPGKVWIGGDGVVLTPGGKP